MPYPLTLATILQRNRLLFGKKEVVSRDFSGIHRYTYADYNVRVAKLANALKRLGVRPGERVATFGWNSHRHLEAYFAVPCMGTVLHTLNIRLFEDQFTFIVNHAEDAVMLVDEDLLPVVEAVADKFPTVRAYVIMSDKKTVPVTRLSPVYSYEALLDAEAGSTIGLRFPMKIRWRPSATPPPPRENRRGSRTPTGGSICTPSRSARPTFWGSGRRMP